MAEKIQKDQFQEKFLMGEGLKVAEFYSDTCIPCKKMAPILAELEEKYKEVYIGKINGAYETELVQEYKVKSSPTFLFFKNGKFSCGNHPISGTAYDLCAGTGTLLPLCI